MCSKRFLLTAAAVCLGGITAVGTVDSSPFPGLTVYTHADATKINDHLDASIADVTITTADGVSAADIAAAGFLSTFPASFTTAGMTSAVDASDALLDEYPFLVGGGINCGAACPLESTELFNTHMGDPTDNYPAQGMGVNVPVKKAGIYNSCVALEILGLSDTVLPFGESTVGLGIYAIDGEVSSGGTLLPAMAGVPSYVNPYVQPEHAYFGDGVATASTPPFARPNGYDLAKTGALCRWSFMKENQYLHFGLKAVAFSTPMAVGTNASATNPLLSMSIGFGGFFDVSNSDVALGISLPEPDSPLTTDFRDLRAWYYNSSTDASDLCAGNWTSEVKATTSATCFFIHVPNALRVFKVENLGVEDVVVQLFAGPSMIDEIGLGVAYTPTFDDWNQVIVGGDFIQHNGFVLMNGSEDLRPLYLTVDQNSILLTRMAKRASGVTRVVSEGLDHSDTLIPAIHLVSVGGSLSTILSANAAVPPTSSEPCFLQPALPSWHFGASWYSPSGDQAYNDSEAILAGTTGTKPYCVYSANGPGGTAGTITFTVKVTKVAATETTAALAITAYRQSYAGEHTGETLKSHYGSGYPLGSVDFDDANKDAEAAASTQSYQALVPLDDTNTATVIVKVTVGTGSKGVFDSARLMIACVDMSAANPGTPITTAHPTQATFCQNTAITAGFTGHPHFSITAKYTPAQFKDNQSEIEEDIDDGPVLATGGNTLFSKIINTGSSTTSAGHCKVVNGTVYTTAASQKCFMNLPTWNACDISDLYLGRSSKTNFSMTCSGKLYAKADFSSGASMTLYTNNMTDAMASTDTAVKMHSATNTSKVDITENDRIGSVKVTFYDPKGVTTITDPDKAPLYAQGMPAVLYSFKTDENQNISDIHIAASVDESSSRAIVLVAALSVAMLITVLF